MFNKYISQTDIRHLIDLYISCERVGAQFGKGLTLLFKRIANSLMM